MSDEEDYDSSEDEEYVPSDGEAVSEEENSGDEENLDALKEDGETVVTGKRKRKSPKKPAGPRKRKGGIQLADNDATGDTNNEDTNDDSENAELAEQIRREQEQKKEEQEKKKADNLWASFMSDVGRSAPRKPAAPSGGLGSLSSISKPIPSTTKPLTMTTVSDTAKSIPPAVPSQSKITVTKVYDFAGEAVQVTKELDVNSKEGQAELKKRQEEEQQQQSGARPADKASTPTVSTSGLKRPGGGLGGVLDKINKKPKMGTLEKSKLDWETFKKKEGIEEELKIHNRGKESYIERMNFLQRTDMKQFEIEKSLRLSSTSKR